MALHVLDEANRCLGCKKPLCQQGCPIHTNIPEVIRLLKDNDKYKDDVFVAGNGRSCQIKRGETVQVPAYVAEVLEQSMAQDNATANLFERESSAYAAEAKARNIYLNRHTARP